MRYTFDEKIIEKDINKYFAFCYSVKKNDDKPWEDIDYNGKYYFARYLNDTEGQNKSENIILDIEQFKLIPLIKGYDPKNKQRSVIVIFGKSGSGKSVLTNRICELYHSMNTDKKIYFVSNNNYMKDTSLNHDLYEFINLNHLIKRFSNPVEMEKFRNGDEFDNSLMVFDDIDLNDNIKDKKTFFVFLGIILKFKRKNLISVIFTTHDVSDYQYTRLLFVELNMYIIYNGSLMNRSNRILEHYLKLRTDEIKRITDNQQSRWTAIDADIKTVITENEIYALK